MLIFGCVRRNCRFDERLEPFLDTYFDETMIRGVNQSMINRYISGGGSVCRCMDGGFNEGSNDGKITVSFTLYTDTSGEPPTTTTTSYIKKEDAARLFNMILSMDSEKYAFYLWDIAYINSDGRMHHNCFPCMSMTTNGVSSDDPYCFINIMAVSNGNTKPSIMITINNGEFDAQRTGILDYNIEAAADIPSTASERRQTFTFYYKER